MVNIATSVLPYEAEPIESASAVAQNTEELKPTAPVGADDSMVGNGITSLQVLATHRK